MIGIAVLIAGAALGFALSRALRIPPIPLLLLSGVVLAQTGLLTAVFLEEALVLGVTFLLFVTGIELNPGRTRAQRPAALRVGFFQFLLLAAAGLAAARALGFDALSSLYLGLALTASSTLVIVRLLRQRRQMFEPAARLVVGVLLLQDLLVIVFVPILTRAPAGAAAMAAGLLGVALLFALTLAVHRWGAPLLLRLQDDEESLLLATLALLFVFIGLTDLLRLPLVAGAFFAGVAISSFPVSAVVRPQLGSIGDFFTAIFFTALGALIRVPSAVELVQAAVLAGLVVVFTPPLVAFVTERAGFSARPALESGLMLSQTSEISLVIGLYGMLEGQISQSVFNVIALVTLITMMLTPLLTSDAVVWGLLRLHPIRRETHIPPPAGGHILILGSGTTGMPLLETLLATGNEVVVVDDDPAVVARLRQADIAVIRGDATDVGVLEEARAREARLITSTIRRPRDNRRLLEYAPDTPTLVRVFEDRDAEWIRALGGTPILYSEAAAESMLRWYDERCGGGAP